MKILAIVKELNYETKTKAETKIVPCDEIVKSKKLAIGCIFNSTPDALGDSFFSAIERGINEQIDRSGYTLGFSISTYQKEISDFESFFKRNAVDGVILLGRYSQKQIELVRSYFSNIVYAGVNYIKEEFSNFDEVICDCYKGVSSIIECLILQGHRRIGFVGEVDTEFINEHRFEAYVDTLHSHNIEYDMSLVVKTEINTMFSSRTAYQSVVQYLDDFHDRLPTAFFCANDITAIGTIRAINEHGLIIPKDISVVGFDGIEMSSYVSPPLSTVNVPKRELGQLAVIALANKILDGRSIPIRIDVPYKLIERKSAKLF